MKKVEEEHQELFHYTDRKGLEGILSSQTLYATHFNYLNDTEETRRFKSALKPPVMEALLKKRSEEWGLSEKDLARGGGYTKICNEETDAKIGALYGALLGVDGKEGAVEPFICSFCTSRGSREIERDGLLSQWRGYGSKGGYALVFDTSGLADLIQKEFEIVMYQPILWGDVVYEGETERLKNELGKHIAVLSKYILEIITHHAQDKSRDDFPEATIERYRALNTCISLYKHRAFREENEVRIVGCRPTESAVKRAMVAGSTERRLVPTVKTSVTGKKYVELFGVQKSRLPIRRIIVGPQRHKESIAKALQEQFKDIEVVVSGIPYVSQGDDLA